MNRNDWLLWRKSGVGASDVPSIMGVSPYRTILDIYDDKACEEIKETTNYIMELGNKLEPIARANYEILQDEDYPPANFVHTIKSHYRASLDGYNANVNKAIEIKYVGKNFFDECPAKYYPQIQYQYAVTLCDEITLVQINNMNKIHCFVVEKNQEYIDEMLKKVDDFWQHVLDRKRDVIVAMVPPKKTRKKNNQQFIDKLKANEKENQNEN